MLLQIYLKSLLKICSRLVVKPVLFLKLNFSKYCCSEKKHIFLAFHIGAYVYPLNVRFNGDKVDFLSKDPENPDKYKPKLSDYDAANWFDLDASLLYILIRGTEPVDVIQAPVVQVTNP